MYRAAVFKYLPLPVFAPNSRLPYETFILLSTSILYRLESCKAIPPSMDIGVENMYMHANEKMNMAPRNFFIARPIQDSTYVLPW